MARIRRLEIRNFRSIKKLDWAPSAGINCLIGPGDNGKSTILDAIDLCLGARRSVGFADTDFYGLVVTEPIEITITLGGLSDELLSLEVYGEFLRGHNAATGQIEPEPRADIETALTVRLEVGADLEPSWQLYSERAKEQGLERGLAWKHRAALAPARIGNYASTHLSWSRNSVLNKLTDERPELGAELASAARDARTAFGNQAGAQLAETLQVVTRIAAGLGVPVGEAQAMLDAHAVSVSDGAIGLHSESGIPLRLLGTGSARLLMAGLQREAAQAATIALLDEVEFGLEPHRLKRLLDSMGAKATNHPLQVFMTTHSPVALRELSGGQLFIVRCEGERHVVRPAGVADEIQGILRTDPEAFLAKSILVCEGASEVGLARGLDQYGVEDHNQTSFFALGGAYVNAGGSTPDLCLEKAVVMRRLGYNVTAFIDADKAPTPALLETLAVQGVTLLTWRAGRALEDELFICMTDAAIDSLLSYAVERIGREDVAAHIRSKSEGHRTLEAIEAERAAQGVYPMATRELLGRAARVSRNGWFKSVSAYQHVGRSIVGPNLQNAEAGFVEVINRLWALNHAA
ncbi:ATP-dependent nuclease [Schauerella aestuarii]|uniref:ATP-dependent nuclease n=1 Tax=Schauerella aestuarii TaxID=2511204 RepID=UPI00136B82C5|nr:ATP-binding protein [Achromobacter aestuarii]MYZ42506.1 ATP-dependent endonuclease [Achromobacter aestuarii]